MSVSDFMSKNLVIADPEMKIFDAVDLMEKHDIHRLPVLEKGKLVGLVTEGTIQEAMPSKATSLSVFEVNYLLNQTTVADVMIKDVQTIEPGALLEDAIAKMRRNNIGVLPVVEQDGKVAGIITNNDIFDAFLKVTGYNDGGTRVQVSIAADSKGVLAKLSQLFTDNDINIITVVVNRKPEETIVEFQLSTSDVEAVRNLLIKNNYTVIEATVTNTVK